MRNTSPDDSDDDNDNKDQSLVAKDYSNLDNKYILALISNLDSNIKYEQIEIYFHDINEKFHTYSKIK